MVRSDENLQPVTREFRGSFLALSLDQLRINLASLVAQRGAHFARAPDHVDWELLL